jgi:heme exporter protein D
MDNLFYIISASSFALAIMILLIVISFTSLKKREKIFNKISKNRKND